MVFIGSAVGNRLFTTAKRCLGPDGEAIVRAAAERTFDRPVEQLTFTEVPQLLESAEPIARAQIGQAVAEALAASLEHLRADIGAGLSGRLVGMLTKSAGPAAEPILRAGCAQLGVPLESLELDRLPDLGEAIHGTTTDLFGSETAARFRAALLEAARARPAGLTKQILALAHEHLGEDGDALIERLCREKLEIELDDLDADGVQLLAAAVRTFGPRMLGTARAASFVEEASRALASPAVALRAQITELTSATVGPLAPEFLEEVCSQHGLPFQAVDYEHLMWLAEMLRAETEPLAGKDAADRLARSVRAFLTGKR